MYPGLAPPAASISTSRSSISGLPVTLGFAITEGALLTFISGWLRLLYFWVLLLTRGVGLTPGFGLILRFLTTIRFDSDPGVWSTGRGIIIPRGLIINIPKV